jgi:predicted nucleic acid-binding protein
MIYYLDSSAWVKRYFDEPGSAWVERLFSQRALLACSHLGLIEVASTTARKAVAGAISSAAAARLRSWLREDWGGFLWVELGPEVATRSLQLAGEYALRGADTIHLASALQLWSDLGGAEGDLTLVTADRELQCAAVKAGLAVADPCAR